MKTSFKSFSSLQHFSSVCFLPAQGSFSGFRTIGLLGRTIYIKTMHCFSQLEMWIRPHRFHGRCPQGLVLKCGSGDIYNRERGCGQIDTLLLAVCPRKKQKVFQNGVPIHFIKTIVFCTHMKLASTRYQDRRRQWHSTPVLLPGKSHGWRNLVGCSPWGR